MRIAVAGAGFAGLAIAHRLADAHDVAVFERAPEAGGKVRTESRDGFLFDWGPNGFLPSATELRTLVEELELGSELVPASPASSARFIFVEGALHRAPSSPPEFLTTTLLSAPSKLLALGEIVVRPQSAGNGDRDESVFAFIERRFGREIAERVAAPALLGVTGGDARTTSLDATFPSLRALEREYGSLLLGAGAMVRASRQSSSRSAMLRRLTTFAGAGMGRLVTRLTERLASRVRTETAIASLTRGDDAWEVGLRLGAGADASTETFACDRVVLTVPAFEAAELVAPLDASLASELRAIAYAPMRVAGVAYKRADVRNPLDGFGFLAARENRVRILGAIYTSSLFPWQAPRGTVYLRVFLGGVFDPDAAAIDSASLRDVVCDDLRKTLGITAEPIGFHDITWRQAIPQYALDHRARLGRIDARLANLPGLTLAGSAYHGAGLGDIARNAAHTAERVGS